MAEISEQDIRATALLCILQHGASAAYFAASRADELLEQGAFEGARVWREILKAIERLQILEPDGSIH